MVFRCPSLNPKQRSFSQRPRRTIGFKVLVRLQPRWLRQKNLSNKRFSSSLLKSQCSWRSLRKMPIRNKISRSVRPQTWFHWTTSHPLRILQLPSTSNPKRPRALHHLWRHQSPSRVQRMWQSRQSSKKAKRSLLTPRPNPRSKRGQRQRPFQLSKSNQSFLFHPKRTSLFHQKSKR